LQASFRPVPLTQSFIGVSEHNALKRQNIITKVAFDKAVASVRRGKQCMVFVHSRKDTVKTARAFIELATAEGQGLLRLLNPLSGEEVEGADALAATASGVKSEGRLSLSEAQWASMQREIGKSRNSDLQELFRSGFGVHHAGMLRPDRSLTERMFAAGVVKVSSRSGRLWVTGICCMLLPLISLVDPCVHGDARVVSQVRVRFGALHKSDSRFH
jgi:replicative superfamily II helicase